MQEMQGAEDDISWMHDGAQALEAELAARQRELDGVPGPEPGQGGRAAEHGSFDPQEMVNRMKVTHYFI